MVCPIPPVRATPTSNRCIVRLGTVTCSGISLVALCRCASISHIPVAKQHFMTRVYMEGKFGAQPAMWTRTGHYRPGSGSRQWPVNGTSGVEPTLTVANQPRSARVVFPSDTGAPVFLRPMCAPHCPYCICSIVFKKIIAVFQYDKTPVLEFCCECIRWVIRIWVWKPGLQFARGLWRAKLHGPPGASSSLRPGCALRLFLCQRESPVCQAPRQPATRVARFRRSAP